MMVKKKFRNLDLHKDNPITTKGRSLESVEAEEAEKRLNEAKLKTAIYSMFDALSLSGLAHRKFILASFSSHCRTHDGQYVPAEGSLIEMSIHDGVCVQSHALLRPGDIPVGFRSECLAKARKTHNIPLDQDELYTDDHTVLESMLKVIFASSVDVNPQPVFCLQEEVEEVKAILKIVFDRACPRNLKQPLVYPLETMLHYFDRAARKAINFDLNSKGGQRQSDAKKPDTPFHPLSVLLSEALDYRLLPCPFHEQLDKFGHCTLGIARRRAFGIISKFCDILRVPMKEGVHIPTPKMFISQDPEAANLDQSLKNIAAMAGEKIPDTNFYGTRLTKMGSMNGVTDRTLFANSDTFNMSSLLEVTESEDASTSFYSSDLNATQESACFGGTKNDESRVASVFSYLSFNPSAHSETIGSINDRTASSRL